MENKYVEMRAAANLADLAAVTADAAAYWVAVYADEILYLDAACAPAYAAEVAYAFVAAARSVPGLAKPLQITGSISEEGE